MGKRESQRGGTIETVSSPLWHVEVATSVTMALPASCHRPQAGFRKLGGSTVLLLPSLGQEGGKWERGKQVETGEGASGQWEGKEEECWEAWP